MYKIYEQIFTGVFPRHYDPPDGFVFEINDVSPPIQVGKPFDLVWKHPILFLLFLPLHRNYIDTVLFSKDDVLLFDYNVQERVNDFVAAALAQVQSKMPRDYHSLHLITMKFGNICVGKHLSHFHWYCHYKMIDTPCVFEVFAFAIFNYTIPKFCEDC